MTSPKKDGEPLSEKEPADEHDNLRKGTDWLKNRYWRSPWLVEPPPSVWRKSDPDIVVSGRSSLETQPNPGASYQVEFDLSVVNFGKLANSDDGLQKKLQATADLLSSCGIRMRHVQITGVNVDNQANDYVPGDIPSPNALAWVLPIALQDLRDADGVASIDNLSNQEQPKVHIGEIDTENELIPATESLIVWPHELGHLLGEMGHPDDLRPSVMHYYALTDWSFTPEQCERMRDWPWMYRYRENASSVEWPPTLGTEEGLELVLKIEGDANEGTRLRSLQRLLLGKVTGETPDNEEEYAFASLIEHFYKAGLPRQGFYLELLWERRHGFTIADSILDPVGFRPAALTREVAAQLRDVYMHSRPEQMLFDPEFLAGEPSADDPASMPKPMVVVSSDEMLEGDRRQAVDLTNPSNLALGAIGTVTTPSMPRAASGYLVSRCLVLTNKSAVFPSAHLARIKAQVTFRPAHASARSLAGRVVAYGGYAGKMYDANDNWALIRLDQALPADAPVIPLYQMSMEQLKDRPLTAAGMLGATDKPYFDSQCKAEGLRVISFTFAHHCQTTTSQMGGPLLARGKDDRLYAIGMLTDDPWTATEDADEFSHHQGINFIPGKIYDLTTMGDRIIAQLKATRCGE
ncbi:trypsin-like serine peptidase [Pseudomonas sp. LT1P18]|uniref:trypsin-like serine peptidase n=1 Tax=Pseudomonas arabinosi TaxID=3398357 RepID=UPI0039EFA2CA